jgi:hypothetical protein
LGEPFGTKNITTPFSNVRFATSTSSPFSFLRTKEGNESPVSISFNCSASAFPSTGAESSSALAYINQRCRRFNARQKTPAGELNQRQGYLQTFFDVVFSSSSPCTPRFFPLDFAWVLPDAPEVGCELEVFLVDRRGPSGVGSSSEGMV